MKKRTKKAAGKAAAKSARRAPKKAVKKVATKKARKAAKKAPKKVQRKAGKRFLIIYHAPVGAMEQTVNSSPEEMEAGMAQWRAWADRVGSRLADLGAPLINGKRINTNGSSMPSTRDVTGYSLLEAEDWEDVVAMLMDHPHISGWNPEATIEIHETMLIPGM